MGGGEEGMTAGRAFPFTLAALVLAGAGCVSVDAGKQTLNLNLEWNYGPAITEAAKILAESKVTPPRVTLELGAPSPEAEPTPEGL